MELLKFIEEDNVIAFMLLLARFAGLMTFFPFFSHMRIPKRVKSLIILLITILSFPYANFLHVHADALSITLAVVSELFLGLCAGISLMLFFSALQLAGEQISYVMGYSMATVVDPGSGMNMPLISQFLNTLALVLFISYGGDHLILKMYFDSLQHLPLGSFNPNENMWNYISKGVLSLFVFGFIFSFPMKALSLLADIIFGMLMKAMPQFNLLVVGFPIKIMIGFAVLVATLGATLAVFKTHILDILEHLYIIFFS